MVLSTPLPQYFMGNFKKPDHCKKFSTTYINELYDRIGNHEFQFAFPEINSLPPPKNR